MVEWGDEEMHVELVIDKAAGKVTAYTYGDHNDLHKAKVKAISTPTLTMTVKGEKVTTISLKADADKGDPTGKSSRFVGADPVLKGEKLQGTVSGKVGTKAYTGEYKQK